MPELKINIFANYRIQEDFKVKKIYNYRMNFKKRGFGLPGFQNWRIIKGRQISSKNPYKLRKIKFPTSEIRIYNYRFLAKIRYFKLWLSLIHIQTPTELQLLKCSLHSLSLHSSYGCKFGINKYINKRIVFSLYSACIS